MTTQIRLWQEQLTHDVYLDTHPTWFACFTAGFSSGFSGRNRVHNSSKQSPQWNSFSCFSICNLHELAVSALTDLAGKNKVYSTFVMHVKVT